VRGPTLTHGYWNDSQLSFSSQLGGYWLTGDLVWADGSGEYFHADRVADSFVSRDGPVYSLLLEEVVMSADPGVADCTVIGVPDGTGALAPLGIVKPRSAASLDLGRLLPAVNETLSRRDWPRLARLLLVEDAEDWPLGPTGKVLKRKLRERHAGSLLGARAGS
jgi:3-aminoavenalumate diazotase